jgi:acetolactate synthase-1/2/3 large subunit
VLLSRAWEALTELTELLQVPVATTINGKGSIAETHPLSLGVIGDNGGRQYANRAIQQADLVFCIGSRLNSVTTCKRSLLQPSSSIVQLDVDPTQIGNNYPVKTGMVGDARATLQKMMDLARSSADGDRRKTSQWLKSVQDDGRRWWSLQEEFLPDSSPLSPRRLVSQLERLLDDDAVIVADPGTPTPWLATLYRVRRAGRSIVIPRAHGGLGYAIPGALGAKLARPQSTVVGITGDGSFGMSAGELETLSRTEAPVAIILLNNRCFGWIKALQHFHCADRYMSVDFSPAVDHVAIALGFGLNAWRLENADDLPEIMHRAWESEKSTLIEVPCPSEVDEVPPVVSWMRSSPGNP